MSSPTRRRGLQPTALVLAFALLWTGLEYAIDHTRGLAGTDPYGYVQPGVDLVERFSFAHPFPLAARLTATDLPAWPAVPVSYGSPTQPERGAISVYPAGLPTLLALAYLVGDEAAVYWVTPVLGWLGLLLTAALAWRLADFERPALRWVVTGLTVWIVGSSYEYTHRSLVPMSDVPSAVAVVGAVLLVWEAVQRRSARRLALAGLLLGWGFLVRAPTLAAMAVLPLVAILAARRRLLGTGPVSVIRGHRWWPRGLVLFAFFVLLGVAADLAYNANYLGHPLADKHADVTGSFSLFWIRHTPGAYLAALSQARELLYLWPLVILGLGLLVRRQPFLALVLLAWVLAFALVYAPFRVTLTFGGAIRYLLPAFPALAFPAAYGTAYLADRAYRRRLLDRVTLLWWVLVGLAVAAYLVRTPLHRPLRPQFPLFGYMSAAERSEWLELAEVLPDRAVVCTGDLEAGSAHFYTGRDVCRPLWWSATQTLKFLELMEREGRPVFLLDAPQLYRTRAVLEPLRPADLPLPDENRFAPRLFRLVP